MPSNKTRLISELSDQEVSRWIAEKLEPFASLDMPRVVITDEAKPSPLGFWLAVEVYDEGDIARWQPRDFVSDPAMWSTLMEQLIILHVSGIVFSKWEDHPTYCVLNNSEIQGRGSLGRAVVEAWMLALGWKAESQ